MGILNRMTADQRYPGAPRVSNPIRTLAGVAITPDTAITSATVWACIRYLSQTVAMPPWHVKKDGKNGPEVQSSHGVDYMLWKRPSREWSSFQFRETLTHWALRWGNGYAELEPSNIPGIPFAMWPIHPERVLVCRATEPTEDAYGTAIETGDLYYEVDTRGATDGIRTVLAAANMFHIRGFGEGPVGVNVISYAAQSLGWARAAQLFGAAFFGNGMNPAGVVVNKKPLKPDGLKRQKAEFEQLYKGPNNANRTAFLDNDADWKAIGFNARDAQLIDVHQFLIEEQCRWFGVPPHKVMHLLRATFCLPAESLVSTEAGPRRIVDVAAGDRVWSRGANGTWQLSTVTHSLCTGIDRILKIITTNRTVRCNAKHPILVRRKHEIPAVGPGGRNRDGKKYRIEWRTEFVPAGELAVGDTVVTLDSLPDIGADTAPNGRALTPGFMAFCGLLVGDGNVFASGVISIARAAQAPYMDFYRDVAAKEFTAGGRSMRSGEEHPMARLKAVDVEAIRAAIENETYVAIAARFGVSTSTISMIAGGRNWVTSMPSPKRSIALGEHERQTRFRSMSAAEELISLGFAGTARTKRVPDWAFGLREDLRLAFLAGFLDADGSVDKKGRVTFYSVSMPLIEQLRHLCMGLGIPVTNAQRQQVKTTLPTGAQFAGEICRFTCSDPGENRRIPTATPLYVKRMHAGKPFGRKARNYPKFGGEGFDEKGCSLARIASIEVEAAEPVYDLCVKDTHNFIADGIVVHNTNIESQGIEVVVDSIAPWVKRFEDEAEYKLFGQNRQKLYTKIDMRGLMRGDMAARIAYYKDMVGIGAYSPNRVLELEDENTIGPDGDIHVMQSQNVTLERIADGTASAPAAPGVTPPADPDKGDDVPPAPEVGEDEETQARLGRQLYALEQMMGETADV